MEEAAPAPSPAPPPPRGVPWITAIACGICAVVFALANLGLGNIVAWLHGPPHDIRAGRFWIPLTDAFVHYHSLHFAYNLYWLWMLGRALEGVLGPLRYAGFLALTAVLSSLPQLAMTDRGGVGMSGVVYGIFGFLWVARHRYPAFAAVLTQQIVRLFVAWFFFCIALTALDVWHIGNIAHGAGCGVGAAAALVHLGRHVRFAASSLVGLGVASATCIAWAPWSASWVGERAAVAYTAKRYDEAVPLLHRYLEVGGDPRWAWARLAFIHSRTGDVEAFRVAMERFRAVAPDRAKEVEAGWTGTLGHVLLTRKEYAAAVPLFRRSLQLGGNAAWIWECLAFIHHRTGDAEALAHAVDRLEALDPAKARRYRNPPSGK